MSLEQETDAEGVEKEAIESEQEVEQQEAETEEEEAPPPSVEDIASKIGWVPKDKFRGDESKWKPADEFIISGRDIQDRTTRELREVRTTLDTIQKTSASIMEQKLREQHEELQSKYETAVAKGDPDEIWKATEELRGVISAREKVFEPRHQPAPEADEWTKKNDWFDPRSARYDPVAHNRAISICNDYAKAGLGNAEQLAKTEAIIRREFPHLYDDKAPPQVNGPTSRSTAPVSGRTRGYADLPKEAKVMAEDWADRGLIGSKEEYAKHYFEQIARKENNRGRN